MKKRKWLSVILILSLLVSGCAATPTEDAAGIHGSETEKVAGTLGSETENVAQEQKPTSTLCVTEEPPTVQITMETEPEPFTFNPHVHSDLLSEFVSEETWASFYNMCDAIRAGEDTFECVSKEAYEWCTDEVTIGSYLPAACTKVVGGGYKDGVGKLKYKMDKEQFLAREQAFEEEICKMLNEATRTDASDFEKLMGIYDFMCKHWVYDYSEIDGASIEEFGNYACLMRRDGICAEIASALTYLLLQCDVEAMPFGTSCEHEWTYVVIGGKGYHVDATWALHGDYPEERLNLDYFMMTEDDRISQGLEKERFQADMVWIWKTDYDLDRFTATDDSFSAIHGGAQFVGMDTEKNVIKYITWDGKQKELSYGDT